VFVTEAQVTLVAVDEDGRKIPVQRRPDAVLAEGCGRSPSKSAKSKAAQRTKPRKGESAAKSRKRKLEP
jgi:acyl-CoA hydrolase